MPKSNRHGIASSRLISISHLHNENVNAQTLTRLTKSHYISPLSLFVRRWSAIRSPPLYHLSPRTNCSRTSRWQHSAKPSKDPTVASYTPRVLFNTVIIISLFILAVHHNIMFSGIKKKKMFFYLFLTNIKYILGTWTRAWRAYQHAASVMYDRSTKNVSTRCVQYDMYTWCILFVWE